MWSLAVGVVAAAAVSTASACTTDANCSLNGACLPTGCVCDRPWTGSSCSQLDFNPTPVGGAYGYGTPFAVTSWGGNSIYDNATKTWHLYVTEMQGDRCGLRAWGTKSSVTHAVSDSVMGPYTKVATVLEHEAHNPQAIVVGGAYYIFHIGTANKSTPAANCSNDESLFPNHHSPSPAAVSPSAAGAAHKQPPAARGTAIGVGAGAKMHAAIQGPPTRVVSHREHLGDRQGDTRGTGISRGGACPPAPPLYTLSPGHCVGPDPTSPNCAGMGDHPEYQLAHGKCPFTLSQCVANLTAQCNAIPSCRAVAFMVSEGRCAEATGVEYKLLRLGSGNLTGNPEWTVYSTPGDGPVPPGPTPPPPSPPGPPSSRIHRAEGPGGPFLPVDAVGYPGCNNPSPFLHLNGTLYVVCTWKLLRAPRPEGPWTAVTALHPPPDWEDPFLFINPRGFHVLAHVYTEAPYPSIAFSGHGYSRDGLTWTWSSEEVYGGEVNRVGGLSEHFATMERPKLIFADPSRPTTPTHLFNGVSPVWNGSQADPCAACGHCSRCKVTPGMDWTYTLARPLVTA
eukprot:m.206085 g.206085  ORF g.206085 m.206085 type:complete len:564 (-) comp15424_c0_seq2:110-1801(-)